MTTTDPLHEALDALARRADLDPVPDRLAGIAHKRRAARHRRTAIGAGVATLAVVAAGVAVSALPHQDEPAPVAGGPHLQVAMRVEPAGAGRVRVSYDLSGTSLSVRDPATGDPVVHGGPLNTRVLLDGEDVGGTDGGAVECDPQGRVETYDEHFGPVLVAVDAGDHTLSVAVDYCGPDGRIESAIDSSRASFLGTPTVADRAWVDLPSPDPVWISGRWDLDGNGTQEVLVDLDQGDLTETVVVTVVDGQLRLATRPGGSDRLLTGTSGGRFHGAGLVDGVLSSWSGEAQPGQDAGSAEMAPRDTPLVGGDWMIDGATLRFTGWVQPHCGGPTVGPAPC